MSDLMRKLERNAREANDRNREARLREEAGKLVRCRLFGSVEGAMLSLARDEAHREQRRKDEETARRNRIFMYD